MLTNFPRCPERTLAHTHAPAATAACMLPPCCCALQCGLRCTGTNPPAALAPCPPPCLQALPARTANQLRHNHACQVQLNRCGCRLLAAAITCRHCLHIPHPLHPSPCTMHSTGPPSFPSHTAGWLAGWLGAGSVIDIAIQGVSQITFAVPALERSPFARLERCCGSPSLDV